MYDEVTGGSHWFRRLLPWHDTCNVVAQAGDGDADRTLVFVAHHDAAHGGAIFDDRGLQRLADRFPDFYAQADKWPPVAGAPFGIAVLVAAAAAMGRRGLLRTGLGVERRGAGRVRRHRVARGGPGANDNATAVAVAARARALARASSRCEGMRVLLVSTGSEESYMEGMRAFARRHFPSLPTARARRSCAWTRSAATPSCCCVEGEGMIGMRDYPTEVKELRRGRGRARGRAAAARPEARASRPTA